MILKLYVLCNFFLRGTVKFENRVVVALGKWHYISMNYVGYTSQNLFQENFKYLSFDTKTSRAFSLNLI